jgi:L-iditol 2-dehydrogenase
MRMIAEGVVDVSAFVSAVAPLEEGASWFGRLHSREKGLMKVLLAP